MLKRIVVLTAIVVAVAVPAALADNGAPPAAGGRGAAPAAAGGRGGPAQLEQRVQQMRQRVIAVATAFRTHCVTGHADVAKCTAAANRMVSALQRVDGRIGTLVGRIQQRCSGGTDSSGSQAVPRACARADKVVQVLQVVQTRVHQLEQKLQDWLANQPAGGSTGSGTSGSSSSADGLEPLDQLAGDLAAARDAATQSGL